MSRHIFVRNLMWNWYKSENEDKFTHLKLIQRIKFDKSSIVVRILPHKSTWLPDEKWFGAPWVLEPHSEFRIFHTIFWYEAMTAELLQIVQCFQYYEIYSLQIISPSNHTELSEWSLNDRSYRTLWYEISSNHIEIGTKEDRNRGTALYYRSFSSHSGKNIHF